MSEKVEGAIDTALDAVYDLARHTAVFHLLKYTSKGMIFDQRRTVSAGEQRECLLQTFAKVGYRHIRTAYKAVPCRNYRAHGGHLTLGSQKGIDYRRERRAEHSQQKHVYYQ